MLGMTWTAVEYDQRTSGGKCTPIKDGSGRTTFLRVTGRRSAMIGGVDARQSRCEFLQLAIGVADKFPEHVQATRTS